MEFGKNVRSSFLYNDTSAGMRRSIVFFGLASILFVNVAV